MYAESFHARKTQHTEYRPVRFVLVQERARGRMRKKKRHENTQEGNGPGRDHTRNDANKTDPGISCGKQFQEPFDPRLVVEGETRRA